ncbi:MAG: molybdopterin biosynthesis protein MoeB, partial [Lysobacteraceae bacterium]
MPIRILTPREARERQQAGAMLVDVRDEHERALGMAEGALGIVRGDLEAEPSRHLPDAGAE